jgi:hypothetical protein
VFFWWSANVEKQLRRIAFRAARPVALQVWLARQERNAVDTLVYQVTAQPPVDHDVVERRLTVSVNGVSSVNTYPGDTTDFGEAVRAVEGSSVVLSLVDVDNAGNESAPALVSYEATDTLPPQRPEFGVVLVREEKTPEPEVNEVEEDDEVE